MAASEYCTRADLHDKGGLPRGALPNPGRAIADTSISTEILTLDGHGFALNAELRFRADAGGSMPAPLVAGTTYYAIPLSDSTFQVAAAIDGAAINLTSAGSNLIVVTPIPYSGAIQWASAMIDDAMPHVAPLIAPYPVTIVTLAAQLAAAYLLNYCGQSSVPLQTIVDAAMKRLEAFKKGQGVRGPIVPASSNLSVVGTSTTSRGWISPSGEGFIP